MKYIKYMHVKYREIEMIYFNNALYLMLKAPIPRLNVHGVFLHFP